MRFLRVLINLRALPPVEDDFPRVVFPLARLIGKLTARKHNSLQGKNALFTVIPKKKTHSKGHVILSSFLTSFALSLCPALYFAFYYWS